MPRIVRRKRPQTADAPWRQAVYRVIFEAETRAGRIFDLALFLVIAISVVVVALESVAGIAARYGTALRVIEWILTIFFTIEYILRLVCIHRMRSYAFSFFGIVDLLSIVPTYLSVLIPGSSSLLVIRSLRLLRMFRVFKLAQFMTEAQVLVGALRASRTKITVFLSGVLSLVVISGTLMYLIEGQSDSGFTNIPKAMYWAIVTMTTVGYGDIAPTTPLGQLLASALMISGYAIIAVPTGIVSAELMLASREITVSTLCCTHCATEGHDPEAIFCYHCGKRLHETDDSLASAPLGETELGSRDPSSS